MSERKLRDQHIDRLPETSTGWERVDALVRDLEREGYTVDVRPYWGIHVDVWITA